MDDDPIRRLLQAADGHSEPPSSGPADLATRVLRAADRQRRIRSGIRAGAGTLVVFLAVTLAAVVAWPDRKTGDPIAFRPPAVDSSELERLQHEVTLLRVRAEATEAAVERMTTRREQRARLEELERKIPRQNPLRQARRQVEQAPCIMVLQADRAYRELGLRDSAMDTYRRTIRLFPLSHWAEVARARLSEIEQHQGGFS